MSIISSLIISVGAIPDECQHKNRLVGMVSNPDTATITVVVVKGMMGTIAYMGYPALEEVRPELRSGEILYDCQLIHTKEQVARGGNKVEPSVAASLFPHIKNWRK